MVHIFQSWLRKNTDLTRNRELLWRNSTEKEMKKIGEAFEMYEEDPRKLIGY